MALKATIFKAELHVADMDRNYFQTHSLTIARHPSETDERMMMRMLAFALHADEALVFGKGLSSDDEPDLWLKDLTGAIEKWIDVGQPDEKIIRRACGRAEQVFVYTYGLRSADAWWEANRNTLARITNLTVANVLQSTSGALAKLAARSMELQCTIQEQQIWLTNGDFTVHVEPVFLKQRALAES
jgi:uncharacterized protein YaeQ